MCAAQAAWLPPAALPYLPEWRQEPEARGGRESLENLAAAARAVSARVAGRLGAHGFQTRMALFEPLKQIV